jgi:twitching motility two-component system response regulator PilG
MKILVADDSPVIRAAVTSILSEAGMDVVTAGDGIEAIQAFYAERPDIVLMDLQMPRMNGYVACRVIKEDFHMAHIPVLILTAHDNAEDRYWAEKSGADAYLTKESLGEELLGAIRSAEATRALSELSRAEPAPRALDQVDVLAQVCEILDRKLFEATIVNEIVTMATRAMDLRSTLTEALLLVGRFVRYDLGGLTLLRNKVLASRCAAGVGAADFDHFRSLTAGHVQQLANVPLTPDELTVWPSGGEEITDSEEAMNGWPSFFAMPLRSRGNVIAVLSLADRRTGAYSPQDVRNLRMAEHPLAAVIDTALHHQRMLEQEARQSLSSLYERQA